MPLPSEDCQALLKHLSGASQTAQRLQGGGTLLSPGPICCVQGQCEAVDGAGAQGDCTALGQKPMRHSVVVQQGESVDHGGQDKVIYQQEGLRCEIANGEGPEECSLAA